MVMDLLRFGYRTTARLWRDDPTETPIYWFRAARTAEVYEPPSYFRSALWDGEFDHGFPVGENRAGYEWRGGVNSAHYLGTNHCGSDAAMSYGGVHGIDPPIITGPDGRAACCAALTQVAQVAVGAQVAARVFWKKSAPSGAVVLAIQQQPPLQSTGPVMGCSVPARQDYDVPYLGEYRWMFSNSPPAGWLLCDGATFSAGTYPSLAALLGDTFGAHAGSSYYLPDPRGRSLIDAGTGSGLTARSPGDAGGEEAHLLTASESGLPAHVHQQQGLAAGGASLSLSADFVRNTLAPFAALVNTQQTGPTTALSPHQNMHPWLCVGYLMIYAVG